MKCREATDDRHGLENTEIPYFSKYVQEGAYHWKFTYPRRRRKSNPRRHAFYDVPLDVVCRKLKRPLRTMTGLDLGCGDGVLLYKALSQGSRIIGIDSNLRGLIIALEEIGKRIAAVPLVLNASCYELPLRSNVFDFITSVELIEHLLHDENFVRECARVLRPGGIFVCTTPRKSLNAGDLHDPYHEREYIPSELYEVLSVSFEEVEILGLHPGWLDWLYRGIHQRPLQRLSRSCLKIVSALWNPYRNVISFNADDRTTCATLIGVGRKPLSLTAGSG